jgi:hypothetical protein
MLQVFIEGGMARLRQWDVHLSFLDPCLKSGRVCAGFTTPAPSPPRALSGGQPSSYRSPMTGGGGGAALPDNQEGQSGKLCGKRALEPGCVNGLTSGGTCSSPGEHMPSLC